MAEVTLASVLAKTLRKWQLPLPFSENTLSESPEPAWEIHDYPETSILDRLCVSVLVDSPTECSLPAMPAEVPDV